MNRENIDRLIDALRAESAEGVPFTFNMSTWLTPDPGGWGIENVCGTVACIAGTAAMLAREDLRQILLTNEDAYEADQQVIRWKHGRDLTFRRAAQDFLDLTEWQTRALFTPQIEDGVLTINEITSVHAIAALEILKETGRVDWPRAVELAHG